jgi:phenylacetic acid degradation operon negative regulatory protein
MMETSNSRGDTGSRRLTARSVLASSLLGADPPELSVAHLVQLSSLFGINANRARVALSRMVASGEVTTDGAGRYRLSGHLLERQRRQNASRAGRTRRWRGDWHVVVVTTTGSTPEVRNYRRKALAFARLSELREGVWLRPDNLDGAIPEDLGPDITTLSARPDQPHELVTRLWDTAGWAERARGLSDQLTANPPRHWRDLEPGFVLSASVLRHFQADPLLPPELLAADWPGQDLRALYDDWDARYRQVLADWTPSP